MSRASSLFLTLVILIAMLYAATAEAQSQPVPICKAVQQQQLDELVAKIMVHGTVRRGYEFADLNDPWIKARMNGGKQ